MDGLPQWLADITISQLLVTIAGVGAIVGFWKKYLSPVSKALRDFLDDWNGEPYRPGRPAKPGVMETLQLHGSQIEEVRKQVTPNHGSTLKLSEELQGLRREVAELSGGVSVLQESLETHIKDVPSVIGAALITAKNTAALMVKEAVETGEFKDEWIQLPFFDETGKELDGEDLEMVVRR